MVDLVRFSDVDFNLDLFQEYVKEYGLNPTALVESGAIYKDAAIQVEAGKASSNIVANDCYIPASGNAVNYDTAISPSATGSVAQSLVVIGRTKVFSTNDLAPYLTSTDPTRAIARFITSYWQRERAKSLIKVLTGVMANSSLTNMVYNISTGSTITDDNRLTPTTLLTGIQSKFGDKFQPIAAMTVHSMVYKHLVSQNLVTFKPLSEQNITVPTFLGITLYVDDLHTTAANSTYTSFLYGRKAIGTADARETAPFEIYKDPLNNSGRQYLVTRQRYIMQPYGISFNSTSLAGSSPTDAELATSSNWTLSYASESYVPVIKIISNV